MVLWRSQSVTPASGSPPEDQPKIFEEFRQVGSDYAHKVGGDRTWINLGQEVCRAAWGKIWVESEVGKAASLLLALPTTLTHSLCQRARL